MASNEGAGAIIIIAIYTFWGSGGWIFNAVSIITIILQVVFHLYLFYPIIMFFILVTKDWDGWAFPDTFIHHFIIVGVFIVLFLVYIFFLCLSFLNFFTRFLFYNKDLCPFTLKETKRQCSMCSMYLGDAAFVESRSGFVGSSSSDGHTQTTTRTTMSQNYSCCPFCAVIKSLFHSIVGAEVMFTSACFEKICKKFCHNFGPVASLCSFVTCWIPFLGLLIMIIVTCSVLASEVYFGLPIGLISMAQFFFVGRVTENIQVFFYIVRLIINVPLYFGMAPMYKRKTKMVEMNDVNLVNSTVPNSSVPT